MKFLSRLPISFIVSGIILIISIGTYLLFPKGQKSEFFYLVLMTIVISGAGSQIVDIFFKKISRKRKFENDIVEKKEDTD